MKTKRYLLLLLIFCLIFGCATTTSSKKLKEISLGMSKNEVIASLGEPTAARGAILNKYRQKIEVWEYRLAMPSDDSAGTVVGKSVFTFLTLGVGAAAFKGKRKDYWLYFYDDTLVQWGQAGDWRREADRIYEYDFNITTEESLIKK